MNNKYNKQWIIECNDTFTLNKDLQMLYQLVEKEWEQH